jgi:Na+-transporting NADH:ubiquinone oxidoreductase subunit C
MQLRLLAGVMAALPGAAFATEYLSAEQAQAVLFPQATRFEPRDRVLTPAALARLQPEAVSQLASGHLRYFEAFNGDTTLGFVAVDEVIGKFERIRFAVGIGADGKLRPVEILQYSESHGSEVRLPAWRRQFAGKTASAALNVGDDIANISGATLSCTHVTDGVRKLVTALAG